MKNIESNLWEDLILTLNHSLAKKHRDSFIIDLNGSGVIHREYESHYSNIFYPYPKIKANILALCSTIHVPTAAALIDAANELKNTPIDIQVKFFTSSKYVVKEISELNEKKQPLLVTVTEGTANLLDNNKNKYKCRRALKCITGKLGWASPRKLEFNTKKERDFLHLISELSFQVTDHETDNIALNDFIQHESRDLSREKKNQVAKLIKEKTRYVDFVPEKIDVFQGLGRNEVSLTAQFMEDLAKKKSSLSEWTFPQNRYIYFNDALSHSFLLKGGNFAKWLQLFLVKKFIFLQSGKGSAWENLLKSMHYRDACEEYIYK